MLTVEPTGRLYPGQRDLSRQAAERHAQLSAVRPARPGPHPRPPRLTWLAPKLGVHRSPKLSFLTKRAS
jgi:hypothetical protein